MTKTMKNEQFCPVDNIDPVLTEEELWSMFDPTFDVEFPPSPWPSLPPSPYQQPKSPLNIEKRNEGLAPSTSACDELEKSVSMLPAPKLPISILWAIVEYGSESPYDAALLAGKLRLVCRAWRGEMSNEVMWKTIYIYWFHDIEYEWPIFQNLTMSIEMYMAMPLVIKDGFVPERDANGKIGETHLSLELRKRLLVDFRGSWRRAWIDLMTNFPSCLGPSPIGRGCYCYDENSKRIMDKANAFYKTLNYKGSKSCGELLYSIVQHMIRKAEQMTGA